MSKNTFFIGIIGIMGLSVILFPAITYADQYYDQYPGIAFQPQTPDLIYEKTGQNGMWHDDATAIPRYYCEVNFNVPDGSTYFIKSIGVRYLDNLINGNVQVHLYRKNLYTGADHIVASWQSSHLGGSSSEMTASQGTNAGYKLVDTKKFAYWLIAFFMMDGDVSPGEQLKLFQVRIHYGT
jgi:hypothetical protein